MLQVVIDGGLLLLVSPVLATPSDLARCLIILPPVAKRVPVGLTELPDDLRIAVVVSESSSMAVLRCSTLYIQCSGVGRVDRTPS